MVVSRLFIAAVMIGTGALVLNGTIFVPIWHEVHAWNPFEFLFKKSLEQRSQEIYKVVVPFTEDMCKDNTALCPLPVSNKALTNKIYAKEQLEGNEYSKIEIEGQASQMLAEATLNPN
jgi:hypothetical protein